MFLIDVSLFSLIMSISLGFSASSPPSTSYLLPFFPPFLIPLNDDLKIGSKYLVILMQLQIHMKPIDKFLIIELYSFLGLEAFIIVELSLCLSLSLMYENVGQSHTKKGIGAQRWSNQVRLYQI